MSEPFRLPIYVDPQPEMAPEPAQTSEDLSYPSWAVRPRTRGDCLKGGPDEQRPCPWITCAYHPYIEISDRGRVDVDVSAMKNTCVLDVADDDGATLEEIGDMFGVTRERIRQLEESGLRRLRKRGVILYLGE